MQCHGESIKRASLENEIAIESGSTALDANRLCMDCGLCCSGTLFSYVTLKKDEHKKLDPSKFTLLEKSKDKFSFKQPCSCLSNNTCTAYFSRPSTCQNFYCILQRKVMNGSIALVEGQKIVSVTKGRASNLKQAIRLPPNASSSGVNLRDFLDAYLKKAAGFKDDDEELLAQREHIQRIFEYLKLVDRFFQETSLLTRFGALVQRVNPKG